MDRGTIRYGGLYTCSSCGLYQPIGPCDNGCTQTQQLKASSRDDSKSMFASMGFWGGMGMMLIFAIVIIVLLLSTGHLAFVSNEPGYAMLSLLGFIVVTAAALYVVRTQTKGGR